MPSFTCNNCNWSGNINEVGALTVKELKTIGVIDKSGFVKPEYVNASLVHCPICTNINLHTV